MSQLIPGIGAKGLYTLQAPFAAKLLTNTAYSCEAVRKLEDIVAAGEDPQALYYTPNALDATKYKADLAAGVCIVSLQAGNGSWVYVPSSFIEQMPNQGGVPYTSLVVAVSLGPVANSTDLSYLKTKLATVVTENIGVAAPEVHVVAVSAVTNISQTEHQTIEAARLANKSENQTDYAKLLAVTAQRDAAYVRITELETQLLAAITAAGG